MSEQKLSQEISHAVSNDENQASTSAAVSNNSQVLTTISLSSTSNEPQGEQTNKNLLLWNMLLSSCGEVGEILKKVLVPEKVIEAIEYFSDMVIGAFMRECWDNTILMRFLDKTDEFEEKKEYLVVMVESLKNVPGALEMKNKNNHNALCRAAINYPQMPYVFGYLAGVMLQKGLDINEKLDKYGHRLLHIIVSKGDEYVETLKLMLTLLKKNSDFNISCPNNLGETLLHIAVNSNNRNFPHKKYLNIIRILIENGADLTIKDNINGETPFHVVFWRDVVDTELLKELIKFSNYALINEKNNDGQTALHLAAQMSDRVQLEDHLEACHLLIGQSALTDVKDTKGRIPFDLVVSKIRRGYLRYIIVL